MSSILVKLISFVFLSIIVDVIMPKSSTTKFIKSLFGFMLVLIIIEPIVTLLNEFISSGFVFK